ncbi:hypothetical protein EBU99_03200 [bacterium]|nr:hypothetical protein [bacterium]
MRNKGFYKNRRESGQALTELSLILPICFFLFSALPNLTQTTQTALQKLNSALDAELHPNIVPLALRQHSMWPQGALTSSSNAKPDSRFTVLLAAPPACRSTLKPESSATATDLPLRARERFEKQHLLSLSTQRALCLTEGSARLTPGAATALWAAYMATTQPSARRAVSYSLCPAISRTGERARALVGFRIQASILAASGKLAKQLINERELCFAGRISAPSLTGHSGL